MLYFGSGACKGVGVGGDDAKEVETKTNGGKKGETEKGHTKCSPMSCATRSSKQLRSPFDNFLSNREEAKDH